MVRLLNIGLGKTNRSFLMGKKWRYEIKREIKDDSYFVSWAEQLKEW